MTEDSHYVWQRKKGVRGKWEDCTAEDVPKGFFDYLQKHPDALYCADKEWVYRRMRMPGKGPKT
jgi:hypothetical protein